MNRRGLLFFLMTILLAGMACALSPDPTPEPTSPEATLTPVPPIEPAIPSLVQTQTLDDYLSANVGMAGFGGEVFCAYDLMGMDAQTDQVSLYLWVLCQEFYAYDQGLDKGSGISVPVAVYLEKSADGYTITGYEIPIEGSDYGPSIRQLFPETLWPQIFGEPDDSYDGYNQRAERLENASEQAAKIYFLFNDGIQTWIWPEYY